MSFEKLLYGSDYLFLFYLDVTLKIFKDNMIVRISDLYQNPPPELDKVLNNLEEDGFIKRNRYSITITLKGKRFLKKGGYKRQAFYKRFSFLLIAIGTLISIISLII